MDKQAKNIFSDFTNRFSLSKTLRFELKPTPRTRKILGLENKKKEIFEKDKERAENYVIIKNYIDILHARFINAALSLSEATIDISAISEKKENSEYDDEGKFSEEQGVENNDEEKTGAKSNEHKKIVNLFNVLSKNGRYKDWIKVDNKNKVSGILFGKEIINILNSEFKEELEIDIPIPTLFFNKDENGKTRRLRDVFNSFGKDNDGEGKDFTTYFSSSFHDNRRNYYKADGKAGRVATRIIDENLKRYLNNIQKFKKIEEWAKEKNSRIFEEFAKGWQEYIEEKKLEDREWLKGFSESNWQDIFSTNYKYFLQKDIDLYNFITRKLNKDINESNYKDSIFLKLHKQIHGEAKKHAEELEVNKENIFSQDDNGFIKKFINHSKNKLRFSNHLFKDKFFNEDFTNLKYVYVSNRAITTISSRCFASWNIFGGKILEYLNKDLPERKQKKKLPDFIDLQTIKNVLGNINSPSLRELFKYKYFEIIDPNDKEREKDRIRLENLHKDLQERDYWKNFLRIVEFEYDSLVELHKDTSEKLLKEATYKKGDKTQTELLFDFAESANGIFRMTNYFSLRKKGIMVEDEKYANRDEIHEQVENYLDGDDNGQEECLINQYYKALKNFVTTKPWIEDKLILTFDNSQFLGGWPKSQEKVKGGVILRKKSNDSFLYYLVVLEGEDKSFFERKSLYEDSKDGLWQKMEYTQLQDASRMLPKIFITPFLVKDEVSGLWIGINRNQKGAKDKIAMGINPSDEILNGYMQGKHTKQNKKNPDYEFLQKYFDYYKKSIKKYYKKEFNFPDTKDFRDTSLFYSWAEENVYNIDFINISDIEIKDLILNENNKKQIYLFQIYNKDFDLDEEIGKAKYGDKFLSKKQWREQNERKAEEKEQGRENLHTTFFKLLFDDKNLKNENGTVYKLSGGAKIFYRPFSDNLVKKKIRVRDNIEKEIVERQRYQEDKLLLFIPIVMNFVNKNKGYRINEDINKLIAETPKGEDRFRIIALDRGEKNLVYLSVLDENGKILQLQSLNTIQRYDKNGNPIIEKNQYHDKDGNLVGKIKKEKFKDYQNLLDKREIDRLKARKSWEVIEKIADLKEGYVSFVVNKIANLVIQSIKNNKIPIIALENLNPGMKQSRIKIEKQAYSKLEEKIAKKLNYLVDKRTDNFLSAWQLTPEIKTFGGDIEGKSQVGIMFYVNPSYTSAICPKCGFRKGNNIKSEKAKSEFQNITISFDGKKYTFKYSDGEVYSNVRRITWNNYANNGKGDVEEIADVTTKISDLFKEFEIENKNINEQLNAKVFNNKEEDKFWTRLTKYFNYILNIRNCINKRRRLNEENKIEEIGTLYDKRDFILCPRCYFNSEDEQKWKELKEKIYIGNDLDNLKFNGDANGSYNIGRKGIIAIEKVRKHQEKINVFKTKWKITQFPKGKSHEIVYVNNRKDWIKILTDEKEQQYYCILFNENEKYSNVSDERKMRRYPDLLIKDEDWNNYLLQNSPN